MDLDWTIGQKVRFNAKSFEWKDWLNTLRTCEHPQVAVYGCVVRTHLIEANEMGAIIAYGVVVSLKTSDDVKRELALTKSAVASKPKRKKVKPNYQSMIRSNIRGFKK